MGAKFCARIHLVDSLLLVGSDVARWFGAGNWFANDVLANERPKFCQQQSPVYRDRADIDTLWCLSLLRHWSIRPNEPPHFGTEIEYTCLDAHVAIDVLMIDGHDAATCGRDDRRVVR